MSIENACATVLRPSVVCLSVCLPICDMCTVAKRCILTKNCVKKQIGNGLCRIEWSRVKVKLVAPMCLEPKRLDIHVGSFQRTTNRKLPMGNQIVAWSMTSLELERSRSRPQYVKAQDLENSCRCCLATIANYQNIYSLLCGSTR